MYTFICYPKCTTCKKAEAWLREHGVGFAIRDIKADSPTKAELAAFHAASKLPLKRFFNTSGLRYRELALKDRLPNMTEEEILALLASDGMLVRRPILVGDGKVLLGFREDEWKNALGI